MIDTWGGRSEFDYTGSTTNGTRITYGAGNEIEVTAEQYETLINYFHERTVLVTPERTNPAQESLEEWLHDNVTQTAIASYVAPILILEGIATRTSNNRLQFLTRRSS